MSNPRWHWIHRATWLLTVFLSPGAFGQSCLDISGEWQVEESAIIVQVLDGESDTERRSASSTIRVTQNGCRFQFTSKGINPVDGSEISLARNGVINGTNLTYSGVAAQPGPGVRCDGNELKGTGYILGNSIYFTSSAHLTCIGGGSRATVDIDGQETFSSPRTLGYTLRGEVHALSATGKPLAGVPLTLSGAASRTTTTDSAGAYRFTGLIPGDYQVTPTATLQRFSPGNATLRLTGDATLPTFVATPSASLEIARIWSGQVANSTFNQLPPDSALQRGAGSWGNTTSLIVCGAGDDGLAHLFCEVRVSPDEPAVQNRAVLRLVRSEGTRAVVAPAVWNGRVASFASAVSGETLACEVEGWLDLNGNGQLDPDVGESIVRAPGTFVVVSRQGYDQAIQQLRAKTFFGLAGVGLPIAYRLLDSFLDGQTPAQSELEGWTPVSSWNDLDHNVGVNFDANGAARVPSYRFGSSSDVARKILASDPIRDWVARVIAQRQPEIQNALAMAGSPDFTFPAQADGAMADLSFPDSENQSQEAWDLYFAFHGVQLTAAQITVFRDDPERVELQGTLHDTYDFRWNVGPLSAIASKVQAGYPTLGKAGGVFRLNIDLAGRIPGTHRDALPWLRLIPTRGPASLWTADLTVPPHRTVVIETSSNLVDWLALATLVPTSAVARVQLPTPAALTSAQFFRVRVEAPQSPPTITAQPIGVTATLGDPLELRVEAEGAAPLTYQWTRNDQPIAGAASPSYRFAGLQITDDAVYRVRVSNPFGTVTSEPAVVHVHPPTYAPNTLAGGVLTMTITNSSVSPVGSVTLRTFTSATAFSGTKSGGTAFSGTYTYTGSGNSRTVETVEVIGSTSGAVQRVDLTFHSTVGGSFALSRPPSLVVTSTGTFVWQPPASAP